MKKTLVESTYCIDVDKDWIEKIITYEIDNMDECLFEILDKIEGVSGTDYNGHFGSYIWVTIDPEKDNDRLWEKIEKTIRGYVGMINLTTK